MLGKRFCHLYAAQWQLSPSALRLLRKMHLRRSSTEVICYMEMLTPRTNFEIHTNSVVPYQTAPRGAVWSGSTLFATETP